MESNLTRVTLATLPSNTNFRPGELVNSADPADFADPADVQKNPRNTDSAEFILTLGENEFRGIRGFQSEVLSFEFLKRGQQQCTCSFSTYTAVERFLNNLLVDLSHQQLWSIVCRV